MVSLALLAFNGNTQLAGPATAGVGSLQLCASRAAAAAAIMTAGCHHRSGARSQRIGCHPRSACPRATAHYRTLLLTGAGRGASRIVHCALVVTKLSPHGQPTGAHHVQVYCRTAVAGVSCTAPQTQEFVAPPEVGLPLCSDEGAGVAGCSGRSDSLPFSHCFASL